MNTLDERATAVSLLALKQWLIEKGWWNKMGKHYARVTFPPIRHETLYGCEAELKVEFV